MSLIYFYANNIATVFPLVLALSALCFHYLEGTMPTMAIHIATVLPYASTISLSCNHYFGISFIPLYANSIATVYPALFYISGSIKT